MKKFFFLFLFMTSLLWAADFSVKTADKLFKNNQFYEALTIYENLLHKNPKNRELLYKLALSYLKIDSPDNGIKILKKLIQDNDKQALQSYKTLANFYISRNQFKQAQILLSEAHQKFNNEKSFMDSLFFVYENENNYDAFLKLFQNYPYSKPKELYYQLITLGVQNNKNTNIKKILEQTKPPIFKKELQAYYFRKMKQWDKSENLYKDLYNSTKQIFYIKELAQMFADAGQPTKAQTTLLSLLNNNKASYEQVSKLLYDFTYYKKAIELYKTMETKFGNNYSEKLINLYKLTYDYKNLIQEYMRYLQYSQDIDTTAENLAELAFVENQKSLVLSTLNQMLPTASPQMKLYIHIIFYKISERSSEKNKAQAELLWCVNKNVDFSFVKESIHQFIIRNWLNSALHIVQTITENKFYPSKQKYWLFLQSKIEFALSHYKEALNTLDSIPPTDSVLYYKAVNLTYLGQYKKSLSVLNKISKPKGKALTEIIVNNLILSNYKSADQYCGKLSKDREFYDETLFLKAYLFIMENKLDEASQNFKKLVSSGNGSYYTVEGLQELFILQDVFEKETNSQIRGVYTEALRNFMAHKYIKTINFLLQLKNSLPKYDFIWDYKIGQLYVLTQKFDKAKTYFQLVQNNDNAVDYLKASASEKIILLTQKRTIKQYQKLMMDYPSYVRQKEIRETLLEMKGSF